MKITLLKNFKSHSKGFVILFTILVSTIILMMGFGIFSIATRETVLSGTAREAQSAFYAADAGVECALYGDRFFDGITPYSSLPLFACGSQTVNVSGQGTAVTPYEFYFRVSANSKACGHVTIFIRQDTKRVVSQGYNLCTAGSDPKPNTANPLLVERVLDTTYVRPTP